MAKATIQAGGTPLDPHVIAHAFVDKYYRILHQSPDLVYRFYQESSILSRPDVNGMMTSTTTLQGINQKIMAMNVGKYLWEIETADAQPSYLSGVFIVVTGYLTGPDRIRRPFAQSFFLAPQKNGLFVLNDILRISVDRPSVGHERHAHSRSYPHSQPSKCSKPTNAAAITAGPAVQVKVPLSTNQEDMELAMAINASIQTAIMEGVPDVMVAQSQAGLYTNGLATSSSTPSTFNRWGPSSSGTNNKEASSSTALNRGVPPDTFLVQPQSALSTRPINASFYSPIQYPSIDSSPIHISTATGKVNTTLGVVTGSSDKKKEGAGTCVICLDASVEGACIPCGHMAGCMGCLRGIKKTRGECPICRAKINQVLKLYAV